MPSIAALSSVRAPQFDGPKPSHHACNSGAWPAVNFESGTLSSSTTRFSKSIFNISSRNFLKLSRTFGGYGNRSSPAPQVSATNSPLTIVPSQLSTGRYGSPNSAVNAFIDSPSVNAPPVAYATPLYSSRYELPPQCGSFSRSRKSLSRRRYAAVSPLTPPPTITTSCFCVAGGCANFFPSRISWQIWLCSPSTSMADESAANSDRSIGQLAAMLPATTYRIKSLRLVLMRLPWSQSR